MKWDRLNKGIDVSQYKFRASEWLLYDSTASSTRVFCVHTEKYILHLSKDYFFQVFQTFIYPQIYHKFIISIKFIQNIFWILIIDTSIKNIKLKQKFNLLLNIFLIQFYNILHQKINFYFEYMTKKEFL